MADNNKPVHQVRIGRIKAAVFENGETLLARSSSPRSTRTKRTSGKVPKVLPARICRCLSKWRTRVHSYLYEQNGQTGKTVLPDPSKVFLRPTMHHRPPLTLFADAHSEDDYG